MTASRQLDKPELSLAFVAVVSIESLTIGKGEAALKFGLRVPSLRKRSAATSSAKTVVTYPLVAALVKAEDILGKNWVWTPINGMQSRFLADFFRVCRNEVLGIPEIQSIASWSAEEINTFLGRRGFDSQLQPFDSSTFGMASVLDLLVEWVRKGKKTRVKCVLDQQWYDAARLKNGITYLRSSLHPHPIAAIATKTGDVVYMTKLDDAPDGFDLVALAEQLANLSHRVHEFGGLVFPMVDLNQQSEVSWILNMRTSTDDRPEAYISQAVQQTILKMNEKGARVKSASGGGVIVLGTPKEKPDIFIDAPFLVWFKRPLLNKPLFVGYIATEDWKNPGSIH